MRAPCSIDGCDREKHARGVCVTHDRRIKNGGHPDFTGKPPGRPLKGQHPTWAAIHKRLSRTRGAASSYACVDCAKQAREWSYDGLDPAQLIDRARGWELAYSLDLEHYVPRCVPCHRRLDIGIRKSKKPYMQLAIEELP